MFANFFSGMFTSASMFIVIPVMIWSLIWKGWALWKSARHGSKIWFVVFLIVNTLGILEILYIYIFSKKKTELTNIETKINE
jgi:methionyl-tRNA synthetase